MTGAGAPSRRRPAPRLALAVAAVAALLAGCAGGDPAIDPGAAPSTSGSIPPTEPGPSSTTTAGADDPDDDLVVVAEALGATVAVFADPTAADPARVLDRADEVSGTLVFVVVGEADHRFQVLLPVRPNGSTGWIERDAVSLSRHAFRIEVELGALRLRVLEHDEVVMEAAIATGTDDTPTPGGVFYIKELLQPPDPGGPYGTYAYGLSGFSNELESFNGGDGVIGIHGTNDPASIGTRVSHGCIRVRNADIERLVEEIGLPLGTPVAILP